MEQVETKVDVLAVLDAFDAREEQRAEESEGVNKLLRERNLANLRKARAAIAELIEAGKRMDKMHALLMAKTNHAASFYDAECFREMNEAPLQMQAALARVGGGK